MREYHKHQPIIDEHGNRVCMRCGAGPYQMIEFPHDCEPTTDDPGLPDYEKLERMESLLNEAARAADFYDQVISSSDDERAAVGTDHHEWLRSVCMKIRDAKNAGEI